MSSLAAQLPVLRTGRLKREANISVNTTKHLIEFIHCQVACSDWRQNTQLAFAVHSKLMLILESVLCRDHCLAT